MPTIGNSLASKLWNIKARSPSGIDNTPLFSEGYEEAYEAQSELGPHLAIFIVTGLFAALFIAGIVTSRVVARQQAKRYPKTLVEESADMKGIEQRMAAFLAQSEPLNLKAKAKLATLRPAVAPALHSPMPKYGNSKTAPSPETESDKNEALAVPAVTVDLLEEEESLSTSQSGLSIIPWALLEGICDEDRSELRATDGAESAKADSSSSFYSDDMLEEMSSIAADLKSLSLGKSMDLEVEVKSVDSERSSARLVEPACEQQPLEGTVESSEVCQPAGNTTESLEDILSQIEGMIDWTGLDGSRVHSEAAFPSRACSTSTLAFESPRITIEEDAEDSSNQRNGSDKYAGLKKPGKLSVIPLAECSPSTTFDNDITLVTSPADKDKSVSSLTSFVSGLELVLVADDSAKYPGGAFLFPPPQASRSGLIRELATVESGSPQSPSDSEITAGEIALPGPSPTRSVLSTIKNGVRSGGISQASRPARRSHARTSSQGLAENRGGTLS